MRSLYNFTIDQRRMSAQLSNELLIYSNCNVLKTERTIATCGLRKIPIEMYQPPQVPESSNSNNNSIGNITKSPGRAFPVTLRHLGRLNEIVSLF